MIRATIETSLIDWDGKLTTVLFFDKCNFMCPFCQNWELILHPEKFPVIQWPEIEKKLTGKKGWIDGVVLTGGEPLVYADEVADIASKVKNLGFLVKLDTNGAYPKKMQELIDKKMLDYVALDIKAPLNEKYSLATGRKVNVEIIKESLDILQKNKVDYELRTTCVPGLIDVEAIHSIGALIKDAKKWFLQQYVPTNAYKEEYKTLHQLKEPEIDELLQIAREYVANVKWRGQIH
ncbi:MAG: anaerobic ribonucleoside-triphosphate reductase activating protein [bacterium]